MKLSAELLPQRIEHPLEPVNRLENPGDRVTRPEVVVADVGGEEQPDEIEQGPGFPWRAHAANGTARLEDGPEIVELARIDVAAAQAHRVVCRVDAWPDARMALDELLGEIDARVQRQGERTPEAAVDLDEMARAGFVGPELDHRDAFEPDGRKQLRRIADHLRTAHAPAERGPSAVERDLVYPLVREAQRRLILPAQEKRARALPRDRLLDDPLLAVPVQLDEKVGKLGRFLDVPRPAFLVRAVGHQAVVCAHDVRRPQALDLRVREGGRRAVQSDLDRLRGRAPLAQNELE